MSKSFFSKMTKTQVKRGGLLDLGFYRHAPLSGARIVNYSATNQFVLRNSLSSTKFSCAKLNSTLHNKIILN